MGEKWGVLGWFPTDGAASTVPLPEAGGFGVCRVCHGRRRCWQRLRDASPNPGGSRCRTAGLQSARLQK